MPLLYYSTQTDLAHTICERYYGGVFYVYCTETFGTPSPRHPVSSNPRAIYEELRNIVLSRDRAHPKRKATLRALRRVAQRKRQANQISQVELQAILWEINKSETGDLAPRLYLIPQNIIDPTRLKPVQVQQRANPSSAEYIIEDLRAHEFDYILGL